MRTEDNYSALEFQGFVADAPTYEKEANVLRFKAKARNLPPLCFKAKGEIAKAYRYILHQGRMVQLTAVPTSRIEDVGGTRVYVIEWEAKRLAVLGSRKTNLGKFDDARIIDGLMPADDEIKDVGYIEPVRFGKFQKRIEDARSEVEKRKGDYPND